MASNEDLQDELEKERRLKDAYRRLAANYAPVFPSDHDSDEEWEENRYRYVDAKVKAMLILKSVGMDE